MALYNIGNFIKQRREELGITQNELAEGLCSLPTLSRLENGTQTPHQSTVRALLQRLGYSDALMFQAAGREEFEIAQLKVKIRQLYNTRDRDGARELFAKLSEYREFFSVSDRQMYEIMYVAFYKDEFTNEENLEKLENALRMTHPDYNIKNLPRIITYEEAMALNIIAAIFSEIGKQDQTIKILYHLKNFYDHGVVDNQETLKSLPVVLYNLSKFLGLSGRYDECIDVCNQGIKLMKDYTRSRCLALTLYNLAWAMMKRGRECDIEPAKYALKEAYCVALVLDNRRSFIERLKKFSMDNFGEELPSIF